MASPTSLRAAGVFAGAAAIDSFFEKLTAMNKILYSRKLETITASEMCDY